MLTKEDITNKNFTYYETIEDTFEEIKDKDIYLALAVINYDDKDDVKFPIKLEYYTNTGLFKITTYYPNPKLFNEYFYMGEALESETFNEVIEDLNFDVEVLDFELIDTYYS